MKTKHLLLLLLLTALAPWAAMAQTYNICEDFESVNVPRPDRIADPPSGWDLYCPNYDPYLADYYPGVCSSGSDYIFTRWPSNTQLLAVLGSNILFLPAGAEIDAGTVTYAIMPEYHKVSTITFNAWKENASYGTLELGYITSGDSNCSTYHRLQTVSLVSYQNATLSNASFSYNVSLPAATGYRLVFKWTHTTTQDWYGAYIDNICVSVPKFHIANTASDTAMTWTQFVSHVNNGATYRGQTVYLDEDLTVNTMVGSNTTKSFQGQFEGQQHTITVNYTANAIYCAPFRYVKDASFHQLKITGTITNSSYKFSAGFAGYCDGTTQFTDCISNITINSSVNGDGTHGGFIAYVPTTGNANFQACVFTGSLLGSNTHSCGGFCGFSDGSIYCYHCIFKPTQVTMSSNNSATFSRVSSTSPYGYYLDHTNYYNTTFGAVQGYLMQKAQNEPPVTMAAYGEDSPDSPYHPLTQIQYFPSYSDGLKYQGALYASSTEIVHVILGGGDSYRTSGATLNYTGSGGHYYFSLGNHATLHIYAVFNEPSNLQYSNLNATSVGLNWTETGSANRWQICINNDMDNLITTTSRWYTLTGLAPETAYMVKVRAVRGDYYSAWTSNISFTTPAISAPTNLQCTPAATSATLNWTQNGSASTWQICFNGDETNLIDVNGRSYTLTGLTPETSYTAKVRAKIGEYNSNWSDEAGFTTTPIPVANLPYSTNFETDCDWNLVNGDLTNAWTWGTAAHNGSGTRGMYVSNDSGATNAYTNTASTMVYATKTFNIEAGVYEFSYDWLAYGEINWDYLRVALVPDSISLNAGTSLPAGLSYSAVPAGWIALDGGSELNLATGWQTMSNEVIIPATGTYKMVFAWRNDNSYGTNPPAAIDNVSIEASNCPFITDLHYTDVGATTATLAWTENGEASAWQICLNGDVANLIDVTENPDTLTNLSPLTTYTAKVRANCGGGDVSAWSDEIEFTTKQLPVDLPYTTDFETTCDWVLVNGVLTNAWAWGEAAHYVEGTYGLYVSNDGGTTNAYTNTASSMVYATKRLNIKAGICEFSYDWLANGETNWDYLRVVLVPDSISLEAGTSLPAGLSYSAVPAGWIALDGGSQLNLVTGWQTVSKEVIIPAAGTYKMVFAWRNDSSAGTNPPAAIDNVSITQISCITPSDLHYAAITPNTATLAWTSYGEATAWQICLNGDEANLIDVTENPYTLTNLSPATAYTAKVRANCGEGDVSSWSNEIGFTTKQLPVDLPYATDFETTCDWMLVNGSLTNAWAWGEAAHSGSGTHGLYVSNDSDTTNAYSNTSSTMVYAYKTFNFEAGAYSFSYDWRANGENYNGTPFDFLRVALVPASVTLEASTSRPTDFNYNTLPDGWMALDGGSQLNLATEWQTASNEVVVPAAGTYKMVFAWRNDSSAGTNPPAAIDNVSITPVTCPAPTGLHLVQGSLSGHEVTMAWDNEEFAQYQFALIQNDFIPDTITFNSPSQGNGQSHYNNLDPETSYTFFLRKYCSDDDQSEIVSLTFTTDVACPAPVDLTATEVYGYSAKLDWTASSDSYTVSYRTKSYTTGLYEQFKTNAVPTGWTRYSGLVDEVLNGSATLAATSSGWNSSTDAFGAYNMKVNIYGNNCKYWLVTPEVNVSSNNTLDFDLALTDYGNSNPIENDTLQADDRFVVLVYADDAWAILREWNNTGSDYVYNTIATTGEPVSIDLSAFVGKVVKIAFYGESTVNGNGDNDLHIDNVGIGLPVPAGEWQTVTVDEASAWLTDLIPEMPYEAKVQGDCGDYGLSEETAIISFTTIEACPVPTEFTAEESLMAPTAADLHWKGSNDVPYYIVMYRTAAGISQPVFTEGFENGLGDWTLRDCEPVNTCAYHADAHTGEVTFRFCYNTNPPQYLISPELSGITEGMRLEFYYRNQSSNYPETFHIGFSSTDNATESFTFGDEITASDAQWHLYGETIPAGTKYICWKYTSNDQLFLFIDDIAVGTGISAGSWRNRSASTTNYKLIGLTPNTKYEAKVRSECSDQWSETIIFTTLPVFYYEDFEADCDWTLINGTCTNAWAWGQASYNWLGNGNHGLYISNDDGNSNTYTVDGAPSMVYAAKTFEFEAGAYIFSYDWQCTGGKNADFLRVALVPDSVVLEAGTTAPTGFSSSSLPSGWIALDDDSQLVYSSGWQQKRSAVVVPASGTYNLVFAWTNNNWGGIDPPASVDNLCIEIPNCPFITDLHYTSLTTTTATLAWTENGEATDWQICLNGDEDNLIDVTENPYNFTGLTPVTAYTVKVRANCGEGDVSIWSDELRFTTKQPAASIPYATGFENTCDWVLVNGDRPNAWAWGEAAHNGEGTHGIYISNDGGATNAFTFNEAISMVYATKTFLFEPGLYTFTYDWRAYGYTNNDFLRVLLVPETVVFEAGTSLPNNGFYGYSSSLPEDWIALDGNLQLLSATEWQTMNQEVVVPTAGLYNMVFAWYNDEWSGDNPPAAIDNVSITSISCAQPTDLRCTATTATSATFSWTENYEATAWQICLNDDETDLIDVTENPCTVTGLTPETLYTAKVRAHCGENDFSAWSNLVSFEASDKILIGTGSATSSYVPFFIHSNYNQTQQIYTIDELGDAGTIVSIDFFKVGNVACERNLDIYMVHTDAYAFQTPPNLAWIPVTAADLVFSGTVDFVDDWWTTITLDTPFPYDGQHNVAILVDDNTGGTINNNVEFLSFNTSGYQSVFYMSFGGNVDPLTNTSWTAPQQSKNQIRVLKQRSVTQTIELASGVNWVSFNVETTLDALKAALVAAMPVSGVTIAAKDDGQTFYNGTRWRGALASLDMAQMYRITVPSACEIVLEGMPVDPASHPITIKSGLNWIAYPFMESMTITDAFAGFAVSGDEVRAKDDGIAKYVGTRWRGALSNLVPGQGYIYNSAATGDRTLVFPTSSGK